MSAVLLAEGYERIATRRWIRSEGRIERQVEVELGKVNDREHCAFTASVGIRVPGAVEAYCGLDAGKRIEGIEGCCLSARLGFLGAEQRDRWWAVTTADPVPEEVDKAIVAELKSLLTGGLRFGGAHLIRPRDVAQLLLEPLGAANQHWLPPSAAIRVMYAAVILRQEGLEEESNAALERARREIARTPLADMFDQLTQRIVRAGPR